MPAEPPAEEPEIEMPSVLSEILDRMFIGPIVHTSEQHEALTQNHPPMSA